MLPGAAPRAVPAAGGAPNVPEHPDAGLGWVRAAGSLFPRSHRFPAVSTPSSWSGTQGVGGGEGLGGVLGWAGTFHGDLSMLLGQHYLAAPLR